MQVTTIMNGPTYRLDSHGNGWAYTLWHKTFIDRPDTWTSLWLQDDDALQLRNELEAIERTFPNDSNDKTLERLFDPYSELFELA